MAAKWPEAMDAQLATGHEFLQFWLLVQALVDEPVLLAKLLAKVLPGGWGEILEGSDTFPVHPGSDLVDHV